MLPDLIIGGAPRSGTTFLCEVLAKHPGVFVGRPIIPEPKVFLTPAPRGEAEYRARYAALFAEAPAGALRLEKTSNYFENDAARDRLSALLPRTKLLFILREPVARAYSNWLWSTKNGLETLPFAEAIRLEGLRPDPLPPERSYARPFDYMRRGRYGSFAESWIAALGRERIKFCLFEDAIRDPEPFIQGVQAFAGLPPLPWSALSTGKVNATSPLPADFDPDLIARLRREIRPEIDRFAAATGTDVTCWIA